MDEFRYFLAAVVVVILPIVITFWLVIHLGSRQWRKMDARFAYSAALVAILIVTAITYSNLDILAGRNLGTNWLFVSAGAVIYAVSWIFWLPIRKQLSFKTFVGVPEVKNEPTPLLDEGPFKLVRHPRYLMVLIGIVGWCLVANYSGAYWIGLVSFFGLLLVVRLEERDLVDRFGQAYVDYQSKVPQIIPTWSGLKAYFASKGNGK